VISTGTTGSAPNAIENGILPMNGKGDKRRPEDRAKIAANWDKIFGNKDKKGEKANPPKKDK
jgi:hypothetical protein|tara:strand:+ start:3584 stop:3769 length:186 start_codon:yes stop_codon:yes gene_type:complete